MLHACVFILFLFCCRLPFNSINRVFASKISKELFDGEDIYLREVTEKSVVESAYHLISPGQLKRVREDQEAHRKGRFTKTSLSMQAIFAGARNAETRRFLRLTGATRDRPLALSRLGTAKSQLAGK